MLFITNCFIAISMEKKKEKKKQNLYTNLLAFLFFPSNPKSSKHSNFRVRKLNNLLTLFIIKVYNEEGFLDSKIDSCINYVHFDSKDNKQNLPFFFLCLLEFFPRCA